MKIFKYEFHQDWIMSCINSLWDNKTYAEIVDLGDQELYDVLLRLYEDGSLSEYIQYMMDGRINNFEAQNRRWIRDYNIEFPEKHHFDDNYMRTVGMVWERYEELLDYEIVESV